MIKNFLIFVVILMLVGLLVNCSDFIEGGILDNDPNRTTEVPLLEQLVGIQPVTYGFIEADIGIYSVLWMQHISGTEHQYTSYEVYIVTTDLFDGKWQQIYEEGGLIDMNEIAERAESKNLRTVAGIAKMHEALVVASAADVWGAMPYSQAAQPDKYPTPKYDDQSVVHDAVLALLDEAIADFAAGQEFFDGSYDFAFGGDKNKWIEAAHTLKARILLNWAEVKPGNYAAALAEAQQGISSPDGNWQATHTDATGEEFIYRQWNDQRPYAKVGKQIVDMLANDNDPRLQFYFGKDEADVYRGSGHGEYYQGASWLNLETFGSKEWDFDMVSWEENQFIIAECQYQTGGDALATLNETLAGIETRWADYLGGVSLPRYSGLTGDALLEAIINEKYKALYLNPQVWNDWKRTGYPVLTTHPDYPDVPHRFLYPEDEANTNGANMPQGLTIFDRNENDPN